MTKAERRMEAVRWLVYTERALARLEREQGDVTAEQLLRVMKRADELRRKRRKAACRHPPPAEVLKAE